MRQKVVNEFGAHLVDKVRVVPHGNFIPSIESASEGSGSNHEQPKKSRQLAVVGFMRPNKGIHKVIEAFAAIDDSDCKLLIVGMCLQKEYRDQLEAAIRKVSRVELHIKQLSEAELIEIHRESLAMVYGFDRCDTSGSIVTAMSLGSAIVAPRLGHVCDLLDESSAELYDPDEGVKGLKEALERVICSSNERLEEMRKRALERIREDDWDKVGRMLRDVYVDALSMRNAEEP